MSRSASCIDTMPDPMGHFGPYGGSYIPETLVTAAGELAAKYKELRHDPEFWNEHRYYLRHYVGRPTPLYSAERLRTHLQGPKVYLKREDLCHTGAHKINNAIGQVLVALRLAKKRII